jgi:leucyl-tRNA synthetase
MVGCIPVILFCALNFPRSTFVIDGSIDGFKPGLLGITPDQMTDEIWEYILCNGPFPSSSPLEQSKADVLKYKYNYFYPFNICSSGKDLINNHLTFALYTHAAIFLKKNGPLSMCANGHVMLNGEKMSKSKGNHLTLRQAVEKFGAHAMRLALADSGDGMEDANFDEKLANTNVLRVHTLLSWCDVHLQLCF